MVIRVSICISLWLFVCLLLCKSTELYSRNNSQPCIITTWVIESRRLLSCLIILDPSPHHMLLPGRQRAHLRVSPWLPRAEDLPAKYGDDREARPGPNWQPAATWDCAQTRSAKPRQARENKWLLWIRGASENQPPSWNISSTVALNPLTRNSSLWVKHCPLPAGRLNANSPESKMFAWLIPLGLLGADWRLQDLSELLTWTRR